jgi:hypothetical protein
MESTPSGSSEKATARILYICAILSVSRSGFILKNNLKVPFLPLLTYLYSIGFETLQDAREQL